ncbi:acid phosphatase type 7-like [Cylas formicarius]|uniref:acid phosphatase type 7-like n=1 Tax=Cylas formicarius TaxID=197179 RepID=UPI0029586112|nr:acid phosphatase type 7-like [Cylas formicarius]XP_060531986.1 acid phosphatase type 7-like [Cylas formicarius]
MGSYSTLIVTTFFLVQLHYTFSQVLYFQPEQIHISYGRTTKQIVVTWSTFNNTESIVEYGIDGLVLKVNGSSKIFVDGGYSKHTQYIHRVLLDNLSSNSKYLYHCGSEKGWSNTFWFKTPPEDDQWSPNLVIYGDMGNENAQSLARLQEETQRGLYDAVLHIGDFAYDMDSNNAEVGDEFMRQIESIAGYLPYMTCPGNHEEAYNFSNYRERFTMHESPASLMFSIDIGPAHIISISTEVYYFLNYGIKPLVFQYEWLEEDLIRANLPENRKKHPWIIVVGHRPMYCSNSNTDDCTNHATFTRIGLPFLRWFGLEKLFYNYGVDLEIWAHEHSYERLWPIYNYTVYNGSFEQPYVNPKAPIHFTTGSAGCKEGRENFNDTRPIWSAFISRDYGYTRLKIYNSTHLYWEQVSDDKLGEIIDHVWVVKYKHEPYSNL